MGTDAEGTIAYSNKAFTKLTGYDQADVIGKSPKLLQGPGTDKKVLARLKESMQQGDGDYEGSAINYRKNGTPFIMHWRVVPVKVGGEIGMNGHFCAIWIFFIGNTCQLFCHPS